jgi:phosphoribosylformimino-5-aminoimidazole carboxamide ribotide isomerase
MRIIPAIDIIEGKCVRLTQGDYGQKKVYNEDPLEVAKEFEDAGFQYLHLVDLDGAKAKHIVNWKVLEKLAAQTSLNIDFGGGIKSDEDVRIAFECGAKQITGGSIAAQNQELFLSWLEKYGADKIILGADAKDGKIAVSGWQEATDLEVTEFIQSYQEKGIEYVICTDISKDGMLQGAANELYEKILSENPDTKLIASGGVSSMDDVLRLKEIGLEGCIIGKAIYEKKIRLDDLIM